MGPYVALAVMLAATVTGHFFWPSRKRRIGRALAARPHARVHEAHGTVRLTGKVRRIGALLQAPLSGRPCVAYELLIYEPVRTGGRSMGVWHCLHDRTGATGGLLSRYPGKHGELGMFLESVGFVPRTWLGFWRPFRYAEGVLEEGAFVWVSGASDREVDPTGDKSDARSPPERLVLRGTDTLPLIISDAREAPPSRSGHS